MSRPIRRIQLHDKPPTRSPSLVPDGPVSPLFGVGLYVTRGGHFACVYAQNQDGLHGHLYRATQPDLAAYMCWRSDGRVQPPRFRGGVFFEYELSTAAHPCCLDRPMTTSEVAIHVSRQRHTCRP